MTEEVNDIPVPMKDRVMQVLGECLAEANGKNVVTMLGTSYALDTSKHHKEIYELLCLLPKEFHWQTGAGHSLLGAIFDRDGQKWADNYGLALHLLALGTSAGMVRELFPARMREVLPGGMPYYIIEANM